MRILSWNIQWGRGADGRVDLARTIAAIRAAGGFDLICLQEVACNFEGLPGGAVGDEVMALAAAFPDHAAVFGAALDVPGGRGGRALFGNLLLSRLPVGQVFRHMLPAPADASAPSMQRVCVEAVVMAAGGPIRVLTTHLEYYSQRQRRAQIAALRGLQAEAAGQAAAPAPAKGSNSSFAAWPRPASAIVCGDFNCEPGSDEHASMQAPIGAEVPAWRDAWMVCRPGVPHPPSVGLHGADWPERAFCCDFFFVSADLAPRVRAVEVLADTPASDHQPVVLELLD
ncbi:endonuclease/exonuclease/phosphatase family protein [Thauera linaloolentis]|uniref:Endonuclease/exonuclease/phosphatase n=1 Tax=Thauera linaloolentis (strain DSM 12138 / JCM 21573 / CCUG 41526 / CIP 105981 / IAM 15112 / NBRC 102519 / 47Lol) TaxID=1123367 RepID=N6YFA9_THAL4|nr:endonuclease/exonuclease/phosphatase family protein [Thauera linaloolentis]ENO90205.1 endonuclease/exonuclease/phosphatase [Thauera linaloolentis 47Lol = DSM 12138]MCM8564658.1 endonuclease/exonuclease/phosphatase family protein [Thauera linaloolentis]